jgi:hypothetical protein
MEARSCLPVFRLAAPADPVAGYSIQMHGVPCGVVDRPRCSVMHATTPEHERSPVMNTQRYASFSLGQRSDQPGPEQDLSLNCALNEPLCHQF